MMALKPLDLRVGDGSVPAPAFDAVSGMNPGGAEFAAFGGLGFEEGFLLGGGLCGRGGCLHEAHGGGFAPIQSEGAVALALAQPGLAQG